MQYTNTSIIHFSRAPSKESRDEDPKKKKITHRDATKTETS